MDPQNSNQAFIVFGNKSFIYAVNLTTGVGTKVETTEVLPSDIYSMRVHSNGNIYFTTFAGLGVLDTSTGDFSIDTNIADILISVELDEDNGRLFLANFDSDDTSSGDILVYDFSSSTTEVLDSSLSPTTVKLNYNSSNNRIIYNDEVTNEIYQLDISTQVKSVLSSATIPADGANSLSNHRSLTLGDNSVAYIYEDALDTFVGTQNYETTQTVYVMDALTGERVVLSRYVVIEE